MKSTFKPTPDVNWKAVFKTLNWKVVDEEDLSIASGTSHFSRSNVERISMKQKSKEEHVVWGD